MNFNFPWRAQTTIYRDSVDLLASQRIGEKIEVVQPIVAAVNVMDRHSVICEPTLSLSRDSAQSLMQALWDAGLRPNDGEGSGE